MDTTLTDADGPAEVHQFEIIAGHCPQVALRILGLAAQEAIIPFWFTCRRYPDALNVSFAIDGLSHKRADILLYKIRSIVMVVEAQLICTAHRYNHTQRIGHT